MYEQTAFIFDIILQRIVFIKVLIFLKIKLRKS